MRRARTGALNPDRPVLFDGAPIPAIIEPFRIRSCEIGSVMFGGAGHGAPAMELVRPAIPRRGCTQSHIDYVAEGFIALKARAETLRGMGIVEQPPALRHFTARIAEL